MTAAASRDNRIDFVKGMLVLAMAIDHWLGYCVSGRPMLYQYVDYVAETFIFYSGFMCGTVYLGKYLADKNYVKPRLLYRGLRIFAMFFILNLIIQTFLGRRLYSGTESGAAMIMNNLSTIFFWGDDRMVSFSILLPISYLLIICSHIFWSARYKYFLLAFIIAAFAACSIMDVNPTYNIKALSIGIGGFFTGTIMSQAAVKINKALYGTIIIALLAVYFIVLVPLRFNASSIFYYYLLINIVVAGLSFIGGYIKANNIISKSILIFGQYSLFLYMFQIFFLQVINRLGYEKSDAIGIKEVCVFAALNLCSVGASILLSNIRNYSLPFDKAYRSVLS